MQDKYLFYKGECMLDLDRLYHRMFGSVGLFCTAGALSFGIGSIKFALFNWILLLMFVIRVCQLIVKNKCKVYYNKQFLPWYILCFIIFFSSLSAIGSLPSLWAGNSLVQASKLCLYILGVIVLFPLNRLYSFKDDFLCGLRYGCIIQLLWGGLQAIYWYAFGIDFNYLVFGELLNVSVEGVDWDNRNVIGGTILRFSGLSWEQANFALVMIIGIVLFKNYYMKILFCLMIIFSYSKTGLLCLVVLMIVKLCEFLQRWCTNFTVRFNINSFGKGVFLLFSCLLLILAEFDKVVFFYETVSTGLDFLYIAIVTEENLSGNIHKLYYTSLLDLLSKSSLTQVVLGYGTFSAGYPYDFYNIVKYGSDWIWNPESDFITIVVGNGIIGAIAYYYIVLKNIFWGKSKANTYISIAVLICGITYLYVRGTWSILLLLYIYIDSLQHSHSRKN